jgi:hypothetical protein
MRRFNLPNLIAPPKTPRNRGEKLNIQNPKSNITLIDLGGLCVSNPEPHATFAMYATQVIGTPLNPFTP